MANFALIGGSGLDQLSLLEGKVIEKIDTPYGCLLYTSDAADE